ncbi:hypothetical protein K461DRAFT_324558 [Myriangium duriaei CBS 260.36]|uniref:Uncharacterized protein n=1 Tax=Myriangium duriaei CBS 260.36 TaxID=1168546 RepID=A0A9P4MDG1_9PEZI|nr:hypothetical protein K461DRAFT_324558 [Myriangium duriaei CBS 260.36]
MPKSRSSAIFNSSSMYGGNVAVSKTNGTPMLFKLTSFVITSLQLWAVTTRWHSSTTTLLSRPSSSIFLIYTQNPWEVLSALTTTKFALAPCPPPCHSTHSSSPSLSLHSFTVSSISFLYGTLTTVTPSSSPSKQAGAVNSRVFPPAVGMMTANAWKLPAKILSRAYLCSSDL